MEHRSRISYCQLVAQILILDGVFTDDERAFLSALMEKLELTDEECREVFNNVNLTDSIEDRLEHLDKETLESLVKDLNEASSVDGEVAPVEQDILARIKAVIAALS